jgi:hypothetical protein
MPGVACKARPVFYDLVTTSDANSQRCGIINVSLDRFLGTLVIALDWQSGASYTHEGLIL